MLLKLALPCCLKVSVNFELKLCWNLFLNFFATLLLPGSIPKLSLPNVWRFICSSCIHLGFLPDFMLGVFPSCPLKRVFTLPPLPQACSFVTVTFVKVKFKITRNYILM